MIKKFLHLICKNNNFYIIQTIICLFVLIILFVLSKVNTTAFYGIRNQYEQKIRESISISGKIGPKHLVLNNSLNKTHGITAAPVNISMPLSLPVENPVVTSDFGVRVDPFTGQKSNHFGLDIGTENNSEIYAVLNGVVEEINENSSYGKYIVIAHGNNIKTLYAHCNEILPSKSESIKRGDKIALVGNTGHSTGPHLHIEFSINDITYNPRPLLKI